VTSLHETGGSIHYLAHDDAPMAMDGDDISIHSTKEMEKYESLCQQEFADYQRVGTEEEHPLILRTIGWGKLYGGDRTTQAMDG
jgi:hypothetical protein